MTWYDDDPQRYALVSEMLQFSLGRRYLHDAAGEVEYAKWLVLVDVLLVKMIGVGYRDVRGEWRIEFQRGTHPYRAALNAARRDPTYRELFEPPESTADELAITLAPDARSTVQHIRAHLADLGQHYGPDSTQTRSAERSLLGCILRLLEMGGHVTSDARLSLMAETTQGVRYGAVFCPSRRQEPTEPTPGTWNPHS